MNEKRSLKSMLRTRFRGALIGSAVADALGFPYQGSSRSYLAALGRDITSDYAKHRSGYFPAGQYSDDTQLALATIESVLEVGEIQSRAVAEALVPLWRENRVVGRDPECTRAIEQWIARPRGGGRGPGDGTGAVKLALPVGLWNFDRPDRIAEQLRGIAELTGVSARGLAAGVAVAAAVAHCLTHRELVLGDFLDDLGAAARPVDARVADTLEELPHLLSLPEERALEEISAHVEVPTGDPRPEGFPPQGVPVVLVALFYFLRSPTNYLDAVQRCLLVGGEVDTIAAVAGGLGGAFVGLEGIPEELVERLQQHGAILRFADHLHTRCDEARRSGTR